MLLALVVLPEVVVPVSSEPVPAVVVLPDSPQPVPVVVVVPKASPEASPEPKVEAAVVPEPIGAPPEPTGQHRTPSAESCSHAPRQSSGRSALSRQYRWQAPEAWSSELGAGSRVRHGAPGTACVVGGTPGGDASLATSAAATMSAAAAILGGSETPYRSRVLL